MTPPNLASQFGDTTFTKVFVGGLAWETKKETMRTYFEQFGDILEAVVITDKNSGRSKGYGFVTFREPEAAMKSCVDPAPVIDGRRANCNLASQGLKRSRPTTPQHVGGRSIRVMKSFGTSVQGGMGTAFTSPAAATFPHYAIQQGIPYNVYGYTPYSPEYTYPTNYQNYYNVYGGTAAEYPTGFYPYYQLGQSTYAHGYSMQYPQMGQYPAVASAAGVTGFATQHYGGTMPLAPNVPAQAGMTMALQATPALTAPAAPHYRFIPAPFTTSIAREQPLA